MAIPGKTLSRVSLNLREGDTAGLPDRISVTYETINDSGDPKLTRKRVPLSYDSSDLNTLTAQQLWDDVVNNIMIRETISQLQIVNDTIPAGTSGVAYSIQFTVYDSTSTVSWSVDPNHDALPTGLALNSATGELSGIPTVSGTFNVEIVVTDSAGLKDRKVYELTINP